MAHFQWSPGLISGPINLILVFNPHASDSNDCRLNGRPRGLIFIKLTFKWVKRGLRGGRSLRWWRWRWLPATFCMAIRQYHDSAATISPRKRFAPRFVKYSSLSLCYRSYHIAQLEKVRGTVIKNVIPQCSKAQLSQRGARKPRNGVRKQLEGGRLGDW